MQNLSVEIYPNHDPDNCTKSYQERREDTVLKLAHFRRHKRKQLKKLPGKTTNYPFHKPDEKQSPGKDVTKKISNVIDKTVNMAKSAKTKKVRFQYFFQ